MNFKNPYALVIVGYKGTGKTTDAKRLHKLSNLPLLCYDVNNDWENNTISELPAIDEFIERAAASKHTFIVFEEATIFFKGQERTDKMTNLLVRIRYTGNKVVLLFHALRPVPIDITDYVDGITLHKTADRKTLIENKYRHDDEILKAFRAVRENPNQHASIFIQTNPNVEQRLEVSKK